MAFKGVEIELIDPQANTEQAREEEQEVDEEKQEKEGALPIEIKLGEVNSNGMFLFIFNQKLKIPEAAMKNYTRYLREQFLDNLLEITIEIFQDGSTFHEEEENLIPLLYEVVLNEFNEDYMNMTLVFEDPMIVSANGEADKLKVRVKNPSHFISQDSGLVLYQGDRKQIYKEYVG